MAASPIDLFATALGRSRVTPAELPPETQSFEDAFGRETAFPRIHAPDSGSDPLPRAPDEQPRGGDGRGVGAFVRESRRTRGRAPAGGGTIFSGSLESSNVDVAEEFVRLIEAQRGFQANARVIRVADELLVELVNLV